MMEKRESSLRLGTLTFSLPLEVESLQSSTETRVLSFSKILSFLLRLICELGGSVTSVTSCDSLQTLSIVKPHKDMVPKAREWSCIPS